MALPYLVSNRHRPDAGDDTHAAALGTLLAELKEGLPLSVATGFVNLGGLHHLATLVTDGRSVRLMLGAAPDPGMGAELPDVRFADQLALLAGERDFARFPPSRAAERLAAVDAWLSRDEVAVRRYTHRFLHGKAYLLGTADDGRAALVTSANLTGAGLERNLELGLVQYGPPAAPAAVAWFDALWADATDFRAGLRALLFPEPGRVDPETVFLRALLELYGEELEAGGDPPPRSALALAPFQRDGFERARQIVARHGGVVYADGVGTGKTEIGLAFVEEYAVRRGVHALVVAPAQLVRGWQDRINAARLPAQVISFSQLATDEQLAPEATHPRRHLSNARDTYRLVVVDEAHALRNPDTTWHRSMERLLGGARKDLVLLSATPVNNGLWDLYHLVMLLARHDRAFAGVGIPSVRDLFVRAGANERDPESLDPDVLFPLADAVSVRRDRRFIEKRYPGATFPDGTPVRFPAPRLETRRYDLDAAHPGLVAEVAATIDALTMARYRPSAYRLAEGEAAEEAALAGLLRSGLLKRFESCWRTALVSVERMIAAHDAFLAGWDAGMVPSRRALREAAAGALDEAGIARWALERLALDDEAEPVGAFRAGYRADVAGDRDRLAGLGATLAALEGVPDPKLAVLREVLATSRARKLAVFTTYGETVHYLDEALGGDAGGRTRLTVIGTETDPDERTRRLGRFCPETVVRPGYVPADGEVDLLIATDVLSEGQNLQQAQAVVSYDMPWNPQRVVQRNGRVIRLKSPHREVLLTTMLPAEGELETLLGLEARIRAKVRAAGVFGMESQVIEDMRGMEAEVAGELRAYADRLASGDPDLLDEAGGADEGTFVGEELRARLARAAAEGELRRLRELPWGLGAGFRQGAGVPSRGAAGAFFACRTPGGERYWRYVDREGTVVDDDLEILRRIDPGPAPGEPGPMELEAAWGLAAGSIVAEHNLRADPRVQAPSPGPLQAFALELLRDPAIALPPGGADAEAALRAERGSGLRRALGEVRAALAAAELTRAEAAERVVAIVAELGLQPVPDPPPLEPVEADDLGVVCWMLVMPASGGGLGCS